MVLIDASNKGGQQSDGGDRHGEVAIPWQERGVAQAKEAAWVLCLTMKAENKHKHNSTNKHTLKQTPQIT